ncbi:MAG: AIPR family protein [Fibrobacter sp.]|nr:AIPR family protein [Fibrobacter sp.]
MSDYQEYKREFLQTLRNDSAINGTDTEDEFINHVLDLLKDYDDLQSPERVNCGETRCSKNRVMRIDGYSIDDADHSLILFISDFEDSFDTPNLTMSRIDELYWKMFYFLDETCNGKISDYFDDSDDMLKVASFVRSKLNIANSDDPEKILKIRFLILTNKELDSKLMNKDLLQSSEKKSKARRKTKSTKKIKKDDFKGLPLEINLWHLERIYDQEKLNLTETVHIDFEKDYGTEGIPCIKGNIGDNLGYQAYIAIIPGKLLADIYIDYGSKVLEGNVRAFLGTGGAKSVNNGIRKTINNEPQNFFTYNNGIAATAANIEFVKQDSQLYITEIDDLQIINGGQTTASLAEAVLKKTNQGLEGIFVPMKLTVIEDRETENVDGISFYDQMVQDIAKYANSQNKVTAADLFSNDPFHIRMEKMSKSYLAPPKRFAVPTAWYYERSRKKYKQEQIKLRGENLKRFLAKYPKEQIVTKEQLAMYLTTVEGKPHIVAKGKNFVIKEFNQNIRETFGKNKNLFNEFFFHKSIAATIIFRTVDDYLEENKDSAKKPTGFWYKAGGFKMDIVPYSIAKILDCLPQGMSIDWESIWQRQKIGPGFMKEIARATKFTNDFICDCNGMIVSEYCKKASTWESFKEVKYTLSQAFVDELIPYSVVKKQEQEASKEKKEGDGLKSLVEFVQLGPVYWNAISELAEKHGVGTNSEKTSLLKAIVFTKKAELPKSNSVPMNVQLMMNDCYAIKEKLVSLGVKIR